MDEIHKIIDSENFSGWLVGVFVPFCGKRVSNGHVPSIVPCLGSGAIFLISGNDCHLKRPGADIMALTDPTLGLETDVPLCLRLQNPF